VHYGDKSEPMKAYIFDYHKLDVSVVGNSVFANIKIVNSEVSIFRVSSIDGHTDDLAILKVVNISYINTSIRKSATLIISDPYENDQNFEIHFENFLFQNINFVKGGKILTFTHLSSNPLIFKNLTI
jgi:hypothetical protein